MTDAGSLSVTVSPSSPACSTLGTTPSRELAFRRLCTRTGSGACRRSEDSQRPPRTATSGSTTGIEAPCRPPARPGTAPRTSCTSHNSPLPCPQCTIKGGFAQGEKRGKKRAVSLVVWGLWDGPESVPRKAGLQGYFLSVRQTAWGWHAGLGIELDAGWGVAACGASIRVARSPTRSKVFKLNLLHISLTSSWLHFRLYRPTTCRHTARASPTRAPGLHATCTLQAMQARSLLDIYHNCNNLTYCQVA